MIATLDTGRKRHTCPICDGTGKLTDEERRVLLNVIDLSDWARDAQHQVQLAVAIQGITKLFLLGIGTAIGAAAMWIGGR